MENRILDSAVIMWIKDPKSCIATPFSLNVSNIFPAVRRARIRFLRTWLAFCNLGCQPKLELFFEAPKGEREYAWDWIPGNNGNQQKLVLKKEKLAQPEKIILAVLDAHQRYQQRCYEYEARKEKAFEKQEKTESPWRGQIHLVSSK